MAKPKSAAAPVGPSRSESISNQLRAAIFEGKYPPGTALREIRIARELGVSQATIRESLQKLEHAGLVVRVPNSGTTVVRLSPRDVRERVELRAELEVKAGLLAAQRMGPGDYAELTHRLETLTAAVQADKHYEAAQADLAFHRFIWHCSGNQTLAAILEQLTVPLFAFVSIIRHSGLQHLTDVMAAHEPLIEALRSADPAQIEIAFREGATQSYREFIEPGGARRAFAYGIMESAL